MRYHSAVIYFSQVAHAEAVLSYVVAMLVKQPKKGSFSQDEGAISAYVMLYIDFIVQMWRLCSGTAKLSFGYKELLGNLP
jgi:hypothetical protein